MNQKQMPAKIAEKIIRIGKLLGKVEADGRNVHSNYSYISYENINARLRNLLSENNLSIIPEVLEYTERDYVTRDRTVIRTLIKMKFRIVDTETGEFIELLWFGADQDSGGKSFGKAITEAQKRFELKLFHISTKDDIDPDSMTIEAGRPDPIEFISKHAELKEICALNRLTKGKIIEAVIAGNYNFEEVKEKLLSYNN